MQMTIDQIADAISKLNKSEAMTIAKIAQRRVLDVQTDEPTTTPEGGTNHE